MSVSMAVTRRPRAARLTARLAVTVVLPTPPFPEVMVIASSDSDFAPLVARLREKGCRVIGVGQQGKTGDETQTVYDDYEVLTHHKTRAAPAPAPAAKTAAKKAPARKAAATRPAARKAAPPPPPPLPEQVLEILRAVPDLARGETMELNVVAAKLREMRLLSRSGSSTRLFQQYPELFVLEPAKQPHKVRAIRPLAV